MYEEVTRGISYVEKIEDNIFMICIRNINFLIKTLELLINWNYTIRSNQAKKENKFTMKWIGGKSMYEDITRGISYLEKNSLLFLMIDRKYNIIIIIFIKVLFCWRKITCTDRFGYTWLATVSGVD